MKYWLMKSEPDVYSWDDLVRDKKTTWDGVRNYTARNNMKEMKKGDQILFYHSNIGKEIVAIAKIVKEHYPDPKDGEWTVVDIGPDKKLKKSVTLAQIKSDKRLKEMALVRLSRLSVQPVTKEEFDLVLALSEEK
jgi:predicted RNA-binding protein with PUA-like domain